MVDSSNCDTGIGSTGSGRPGHRPAARRRVGVACLTVGLLAAAAVGLAPGRTTGTPAAHQGSRVTALTAEEAVVDPGATPTPAAPVHSRLSPTTTTAPVTTPATTMPVTTTTPAAATPATTTPVAATPATTTPAAATPAAATPATTTPVTTGPTVASLVAEVEAAGIDPGYDWSWSSGDTATECGVIAVPGVATGCTFGPAGGARTVFSGTPTLALVAHELANAETENDAVPSLVAEVSLAAAGTSWSAIDAVASCLVEHFLGFQDGAAGPWQCPASLAATVAEHIHTT